MKNWRVWVGFGAAILIAAAGIYAAYQWWLADPESIGTDAKMGAVRRGPLTVSVKALGSVSTPSRHTLTFGVSGKLKELHVAEGDVVRAGALLARLDTGDQELQVMRAEAALAQSRAQLARAQAGPSQLDIQAATEALAAAEARYERVKAGPLAAEIASAEAAVRSAQASADELNRGLSEDQRLVLKANVDKADIALKQAQSAYDKVAWQPGSQARPEAAALEKATVEYQQALASYNVATAGASGDQVQRAQAQIALARAQLERLKATGANDELKAASAQVARARADLDKLTNSPSPQDVAIAQAQVEQAEVSLRQAKRLLDDCTLVAPLGGTVVALGANVGQWIAPSSPVVVLADLADLRIQANIHESQIDSLRLGQRALITLEALSDLPLEGRVTEIAPFGIATAGTISYLATIKVASPNVPIRPGMLATVEVIVTEFQDALTVPRGALRLIGGGWTVQVRRNGRLTEVEVKTGACQGRLVQVLEGLLEGDQVLLHTVPVLMEAQ